MKKKAFTLMELMVAMGLLAIVMVMAGSIFRVALESYRVARANGEIMQKLRVITSQLDRDLQDLCQQDQAFTVCQTQPDPGNPLGRGRFDRLVFFANGDFDSYHQAQLETDGSVKTVHGNTARISYMLARLRTSAKYVSACRVPPVKRILARTQHILTPEDFRWLDPNALGTDATGWFNWHNHQEYDRMTLLDWARLRTAVKANALSAITDVNVPGSTLVGEPSFDRRGACVDPCDPNNSIHMVLCEGVGEFTVQGWDDLHQQWVPEADGTGTLAEVSYLGLPSDGRALKFTFTLYDSKGIIKKGRTFTHIVYLKD